MAVTLTVLKTLDEKVTASAASATDIYFGTNKGNVYVYSVGLATITKLKSLNRSVESMVLYGTTLYMGLGGGRFASMTTS